MSGRPSLAWRPDVYYAPAGTGRLGATHTQGDGSQGGSVSCPTWSPVRVSERTSLCPSRGFPRCGPEDPARRMDEQSLSWSPQATALGRIFRCARDESKRVTRLLSRPDSCSARRPRWWNPRTHEQWGFSFRPLGGAFLKLLGSLSPNPYVGNVQAVGSLGGPGGDSRGRELPCWAGRIPQGAVRQSSQSARQGTFLLSPPRTGPEKVPLETRGIKSWEFPSPPATSRSSVQERPGFCLFSGVSHHNWSPQLVLTLWGA